MNIEALKSCLSPWMQIDTWHTGHPLDEKRFHLALEQTFALLGTGIDGGYFSEAITELVEKYHPSFDSEVGAELINKYAIKAELIASYLSNTRD